LDGAFGDDSGNLYKPSGPGANLQASQFDPRWFPKLTNKASDWSDVARLVRTLHDERSDASAWRKGLESTIDVGGFLRWLAVNTVIQNYDSYGVAPHNYLLYASPRDAGRFQWIPIDFNRALYDGPSSPESRARRLDLSDVDGRWPLIRFLIDDPAYRGAYYREMAGFLAEVYKPEAIKSLIERARDRVAPYVIGPEGERPGFTVTTPDDFRVFTNALLTHADRRHAEAQAALAAVPR
jgi:spore coat protein CotH